VNERRAHLRFDKAFTVYLSTAGGLSRGVGRNISERGLFVETREPLGLGEQVRVTFSGEDGAELSCLCEVRYQVALAYGRKDGRPGNSRGVGLRVVAYETSEGQPLLLVDRERVLH
jgi:hypothetical protein